ncbi:hypothetical protein DFH27DRAFT_642638 [Peziza echinospora]|nr:hypothetical protein DFH27DRAFT_642638 [Peziza echinospora]
MGQFWLCNSYHLSPPRSVLAIPGACSMETEYPAEEATYLAMNAKMMGFFLLGGVKKQGRESGRQCLGFVKTSDGKTAMLSTFVPGGVAREIAWGEGGIADDEDGTKAGVVASQVEKESRTRETRKQPGCEICSVMASAPSEWATNESVPTRTHRTVLRLASHIPSHSRTGYPCSPAPVQLPYGGSCRSVLRARGHQSTYSPAAPFFVSFRPIVNSIVTAPVHGLRNQLPRGLYVPHYHQATHYRY